MARKRQADVNGIFGDWYHSSDPFTVSLVRANAARYLNIEVEQIPAECDTPAKVHAWEIAVDSCNGRMDLTREIYDRQAPKAKRIEVSGPGGGPVRHAVGSGDDPSGKLAAERYLEEVARGRGPSPEPDDDSDLLA